LECRLADAADEMFDKLVGAMFTRARWRKERQYQATGETRRSLARGFGFEDWEVFNRVEMGQQFREIIDDLGKASMKQFDEQHPDLVRLKMERAGRGSHLARAAENATCYWQHYDDDIADEAKAGAAMLFDYLREYGDAAELYSETEKFSVFSDLDGMLKDIEASGAAVHFAMRRCAVVGNDWPDETPHAIVIFYLVIAPVENVMGEIAVAKAIQFGI
jgi:hypothetical protein